MKYHDPNMESFWNALSPQVQARINDTGIELYSLGMLMKLGDYYQNSHDRSHADTMTTENTQSLHHSEENSTAKENGTWSTPLFDTIKSEGKSSNRCRL